MKKADIESKIAKALNARKTDQGKWIIDVSTKREPSIDIELDLTRSFNRLVVLFKTISTDTNVGTKVKAK